ncbi:MAG: alpha-amylase family glycosyl hydrolase [Planctomycetota bacterium]|nr:alpha-amylase family glycosyl hydrolase [Planctomycetota bacterium]
MPSVRRSSFARASVALAVCVLLAWGVVQLRAPAAGLAAGPEPVAPAASTPHYNGSPADVMLQGFHWRSCDRFWYRTVREQAAEIQRAGFTVVWLPPPADSVVPQGYIPRRWYKLDTAYGTADELKAAIAALKPGAVAIADVVLNHRAGDRTSGSDFVDPSFDDNDAAICKGDEYASAKGAPDSGEGAGYGRDLDHSNPSVQNEIIKWLRWLKSDIGFAGWRYDMVKGYAGGYVGRYNAAVEPVFSVGEFWDGDRQKVVAWIDATGGRSRAFDFPTRGFLKRALAGNDFALLKAADGKCAGVLGIRPEMCVTFLENHDTEAANHNDPFPRDKLMQGYAYLLTHPGVPCVFWPHYFDADTPQRRQIEDLMTIRRKYGIHSGSTVNIVAAGTGCYAAFVHVKDGSEKIAVKIGPESWSPGDGWRVAASGNEYAVWVRN